MEHAAELRPSFPWRTAAVVLAAIAAFELLALVAIGAIRLAPHPRAHAATAATPPAHHVSVPAVRPAPVVPQHPLRPRADVSLLVLNGNGVQGAAAAEAARLHGLGYPFARTENAPRHDYARSLVMYVPGFAAEARRLARDAGVRLVSPVDGIRPAQLRRFRIVLILGT